MLNFTLLAINKTGKNVNRNSNLHDVTHSETGTKHHLGAQISPLVAISDSTDKLANVALQNTENVRHE